MIYHVVPLAEWNTDPGRPYAPASLTEAGFVHCSPDEGRLTARYVREPADPTPPPGIPEGTLLPHVLGPLARNAVQRVLEVRWDDEGRATSLF